MRVAPLPERRDDRIARRFASAYMLPVDYLILAVVLISTLIGAYRGFFPEVLSLLSWVAAIWIAWEYGSALEPRLGDKIPSPVLALWIARFALFAGVLIAGGVVTELVSLVIEKTHLTGPNRALGVLFGFARGLIAVGVLTIFAQILELPHEAWWRQSKLIPYGERIAGGLEALLPESVFEQLPETPVEQPT
jgi:membrane protein required for colicin V production